MSIAFKLLLFLMATRPAGLLLAGESGPAPVADLKIAGAAGLVLAIWLLVERRSWSLRR